MKISAKTLRILAHVLMLPLFLIACSSLPPGELQTKTTSPSIEILLTGLDNPRGVAVRKAGDLFLAQAGSGFHSVDPQKMTGKLTHYTDLNGDGDFEDPGEADIWFRHFPTYNASNFTASVRDEVGGPGDLLLHEDGRLFLTLDGGFDQRGVFEISPTGRIGRNLDNRGGTMNAIAFDPSQENLYIAESSFNRLVVVSLQSGELRDLVTFPLLEQGQEAVPAGLAVDPRSGDVLVALFSGAVFDPESEEITLFVPGAAKIVRVDPSTGTITDEISGLTTAVDVAVDQAGNIITVEMTTTFSEPFPEGFDFTQPDAPPLHGGYQRYSGRITLYPADGGPPCTLLEGLDTPTNITYAPDGALYISTGQGTPGRPIPGPQGVTHISGELIRISNYKAGCQR